MRLLLILLQAILITACTSTDVIPQPAGEDLQAGTVDFAYFQRPGATSSIDWENVQVQAVQRCEALGYSDARNTDEVDRLCVDRGGNQGAQASVRVGASRSVFEPVQTLGVPVLGDSCSEIRYTVTYQCTE